MNRLKEELKTIDWSTVLNCNDANNISMDKFNQLYNSNLPLETKKINRQVSRQQWITPGILERIIMKNKMYILLKIKKKVTKYKKYINKLTYDLKICEKEYYEKKFEQNKHNLSKTWKTLHSVINSRNISTINSFEIKLNGKKLTYDTNIVNYCNTFFLKAPVNLCQNIPNQTVNPCSFMKDKNVIPYF